MDLQRRNYIRVFEEISVIDNNVHDNTLGLWGYIERSCDMLNDYCVVEYDGRYKVNAVLPILTPRDVETILGFQQELLKSENSREDCIELSLFVVTSIKYIVDLSAMSNFNFNFGKLDVFINMAMSRYVSLNEFIEFIEFSEGSHNIIASTAERFRQDVDEKMNEVSNKHLSTLIDLTDIASGRDKMYQSVQQLKLAVDSSIEKIMQEINNNKVSFTSS